MEVEGVVNGLNYYHVEWETTANMIIAFPFAPKSNEFPNNKDEGEKEKLQKD